MENFKDRNYYPVAWNKMCVTSTSTSGAIIIDGTNTLNNKYAILYKSDDGDDIGSVGSIYIGTGVTFAAGTTPTQIIDVTTGVGLEQSFYNNSELVFKWVSVYNTDGQLINFKIVNAAGIEFNAVEI